MSTEFDTWLAELASAGKGGSDLTDSDIPPATRGLAWSMPIVFAGNWTSATITGTISASPDAASPLATLSFDTASYDSGLQETTWNASLASGTGSNSTGSLPADTDGDGVERFPLAVYLTPSGGTQMMLFGGLFTLLGKA